MHIMKVKAREVTDVKEKEQEKEDVKKNCRQADDVKMKEREEMITWKRKYGRVCVEEVYANRF